MKVCYDKIENMVVSADIQRLLGQYDEGGEVEYVGAAGGKEDSRWVWRKKFPVANTSCSRYLIGGDLEDSIVSRRPREFRYEEASGGEMVYPEEVEAVPVLEGVDGDPVRPLFKGVAHLSSNRTDAYKSILSSLSLSSSGDSGVFLESGKGGGVGSGAEDSEDDAFSDIDVEEVQDTDDVRPTRFSSSFASAHFFPEVSRMAAKLFKRCLVSPESASSGGVSAASSLFPQAPVSSQIQNSQLEMHVEQEGGKEKEETEGNEECMGPQKAHREGKEDGAMPPSPVASAVSGIWIGRKEDALRVQEVEKEKEKEGVHVVPEDKKEKEDEEEALRERLEKLKERLVQVIREKEKRRRPLPRVVPIDAEIQKKMMDHVNPRKGHIDATAEEVAGGSHEGGMRSELERFLEEKVFARRQCGKVRRANAATVRQEEKGTAQEFKE
uniref:Uncharacterized protein n=1 Tax=Chromera velia CCMP2878 TaxID=1169474 RepID=A0A0G4FSC5_9ALVE|eukprot:Cvel_3696.t1-p1 / transcript=Cvel_3696.t1 / gene=Cvel_3696 / organism=Chromera_velia_CCMP2878 / gene_product=hypothetical protein / transcript_product=hypothetical protein / location=Cvel_scaffold153:109302-116800(+) / protein_length=438 / sequence_SO=supercontig / SO=protein_coding / is_pseudo=false